MFFETKELVIETGTIQDMPPFIFDIYDEDQGLDGDDFICRSVIQVKDCAYSEEDTIPTPKWHPCRLKAGAPT